uniref:MSP domain-containing protein n=1 Tax=Syphacia muris TaxID=451379 RepID=A0A0N5AQW4_9BILA
MPAAFALSWKIQWLDSFPVPCGEKEAILKRIERFKPSAPPVFVEFSVSLSGIKVVLVNEKHNCNPALKHAYIYGS